MTFRVVCDDGLDIGRDFLNRISAEVVAESYELQGNHCRIEEVDEVTARLGFVSRLQKTP